MHGLSDALDRREKKHSKSRNENELLPVGTGARSMDRELWINNLRVENFPQVLYKEEAHLYFFVKGGILLLSRSR